MKILNKYRFIRGAKSDAPVPKLVPPPDGQNVLKSLSLSSTVDALCEGPIYGLVDQFGKKIYGLDMLKGIYLNKIPVMNAYGEYNFRNILMEINLGTENQKPLVNFNNVHIFKAANFKLLGKIDPNEKDSRVGGDFTAWAKGNNGWPTLPQDPFVYVHHIRNKDVKKLKIGFIIEQLYDTIDKGLGPGDTGKMGMNKASRVEIFIKWGLEGSKTFSARTVVIEGLVQSPYAYMIGDEVSTLDSSSGSTSSAGAFVGTFGSTIINSSAIPSTNNSNDSRKINVIANELSLNKMNYKEGQ